MQVPEFSRLTNLFTVHWLCLLLALYFHLLLNYRKRQSRLHFFRSFRVCRKIFHQSVEGSIHLQSSAGGAASEPAPVCNDSLKILTDSYCKIKSSGMNWIELRQLWIELWCPSSLQIWADHFMTYFWATLEFLSWRSLQTSKYAC